MRLGKKALAQKPVEKPGKKAEAEMPQKVTMGVKVIRASGEVENLGKFEGEIQEGEKHGQ